ncbi:MAG: dephospho-CoA kinase [Lachnospiraceae bacterium]|nr:dephospho-CoA kinase [Lachnospiraceae bacterium]
MLFIGITGGVGAGKSEILKHLRENPHFLVSEADRIAESLMEPGEEVYNKVLSLLGKEILAPDGQINRKKMAGIIFADKEKLSGINGIIHPAVKEYVLKEKRKAEEDGIQIYFLEAALLIECGYDKICDELWYIYAEPEVRRERLKESRGYSDEKIDGIMKSQNDDRVYRESCSRIIDNSGSIESTLYEIDRITGGYKG